MSAARVAIIPARGGSKRIPRKNIRPFAGRPMIAYAIAAARESGLFDHVVVSTEDEEIATVVAAHGGEAPFRRPAELADDYTPTVPVVAHAIEACEALWGRIDEACCIYPCVPLLEARDLAAAHALLAEGGERYAFPVVAFESSVHRALAREPSGRTRPLFPQFAQTRTQDLPAAYHDAGQFYWGVRDAWLAGESIHENGATLVLPASKVVDIDTPDDWARAETLFGARVGGAG
ncbi:pseudaminic acid cytidylyltransferase [Salinarimonas chemoclinalis]|uniref:pseudaminic acid cytidylyltransferase n=1 Tax=Salinarimonas chemoclinalis TaxID=3241599 RepID=UPI003555FD07